jgi:3-keto-disaccharide hydrolase
MYRRRILTALVATLLAVAAMVRGRADGDEGQAQAGAPPDPARQADPYPGCVKIFDGKSFRGWEADPSTWSIVDGAMRGFGGTSRLAYTTADYGSFRLIFTARMAPVNRDHLGVLFWGDRPKDPSKPKIDNAGWIQFMPPHGAMWDYHPPKHHNLPHETLAKGSRDFTRWCTTELLCDLEKGTMRAAVDGVEIARYTHPHPGERNDPEKRIIPGPIGMFRHGAGASEYKDIYVEVNPKSDRLLTVR